MLISNVSKRNIVMYKKANPEKGCIAQEKNFILGNLV